MSIRSSRPLIGGSRKICKNWFALARCNVGILVNDDLVREITLANDHFVLTPAVSAPMSLALLLQVTIFACAS